MSEGATLLELQDVDLELRRATKQLDEMPEKRAIIAARHKIKEVETLKVKAEELVRRLAQEVSRLEDESSVLGEKIASEQKRVMSGEVTNSKELQHMAREIDSLKRRREKLEMEQLAAIDRSEKASGQVAKVDTALERLRAEEVRLIDVFKDKGGELQGRIDELGREREALAAKLPADLLERYDELRVSKGGGAGAGRLDGVKCTACRMELPAQRVSELQAGGEIGVCPACRRLLVVTLTAEDAQDE